MVEAFDGDPARTEVLLVHPKRLLELGIVQIHLEAGCAAGTIKRREWMSAVKKGMAGWRGGRAVSRMQDVSVGTAGEGTLTWV